MSKNVAVFVDVANLYYSARGQDTDVDYVALLKAATKGRDLIRAYAYSGLDPENENQRKFIDFLNKNGYKVLTKDIRKFGDGRVKANLDIELVVDLFRLADRMDIAVIVSGDGDFAPAIKALQDKGVRCEVISFRPNTSSDLIAVADEFIDIMKIIGIGRSTKDAKEAKEPRADKVMSAPEMPAKEVVPEFGFREASPSVAAAALAALREGREGGGRPSAGRGRGRGRGRGEAPAVTPAASPAPTEEVPAAVAIPIAADNGSAATDGDGRRRRRRRGGRGRGRGRGQGAETTPTTAAGEAGEPGEIGWTELDDLSQLEGLEGLDEEREYTFEEADPETLAELGLLDAGEAAAQTADAGAAEEQPAEAPKRRTRGTSGTGRTRGTRGTSRTRGAKAAAAEGEAAAEEQPAAAPRRRTRTTKAAATEAEPAQAEPAKEGAAPAARRRTRTAKADEASDASEASEPKPARRTRSARPSARAATSGEAAATDEGGGDAQGIWKRFRSARGEKPSA